MADRDQESLDDVISRVEFYADDTNDATAYNESGRALVDAERLTLAILRVTVENEHYRLALQRIEVEDHEGGPGWFAEIAAEALHRYRT